MILGTNRGPCICFNMPVCLFGQKVLKYTIPSFYVYMKSDLSTFHRDFVWICPIETDRVSHFHFHAMFEKYVVITGKTRTASEYTRTNQCQKLN